MITEKKRYTWYKLSDDGLLKKVEDFYQNFETEEQAVAGLHDQLCHSKHGDYFGYHEEYQLVVSYTLVKKPAKDPYEEKPKVKKAKKKKSPPREAKAEDNA